MRAVSMILPPSYVFEGMRAIVLGQATPWGQLAIGAALSIVYLVASGVVFSAVYRHAIRTGLIARYSAESVA